MVSEIQVPATEPPLAEPADQLEPVTPPWLLRPDSAVPLDAYVLAANGWNMEHLQDIDDAVIDEKEISSLGYDGPLAVLARHRVNIADFFKETVAVVTNPAIDRGREAEVFSTSSLFGAGPTIGRAPDPNDIMVTLKIPVLTGGHPDLGSPKLAQSLAEKSGTLSIEQVLETFNGHTTWLVLGVLPGEDVPAALDRLATQAVVAVDNGSQCLMLDDDETHRPGLWLAGPQPGGQPHRRNPAPDRQGPQAESAPQGRPGGAQRRHPHPARYCPVVRLWGGCASTPMPCWLWR